MTTIYLDNNATTSVAPEVLEAMLPYFHAFYGNPSSMHSFGGQVGRSLLAAREQVAALLGAGPEEIIFTSCGTESDNTAIRAALAARPGRKHIVTTRVEHPAIHALVTHLAREGYRVTELPVDAAGRLDLEHYAKSLTPDTAVVSAMWANNETGVLFPVAEMAVMARHRGILFHTDAVQAVGKIPIDLGISPIDMLSLSGHKLHAAKGVGALYVRKGTRFSPFLIGGHQEKGRRGGTENVPGIIGLGLACELAAQNLEQENTLVKSLRDRLENALLEHSAQQPGERRPAGPPAQHQQYQLRIRRRRGHSSDDQRIRHLRLLGLRLHLRVAAAVPRAPRHGRALHHGPRLHPLQLERL